MTAWMRSAPASVGKDSRFFEGRQGVFFSRQGLEYLTQFPTSRSGAAGSPGWRRGASVRPDPVGRIRQEPQPAPIASVRRSAADGWPLRTGRCWRRTAGPTEKPFQAPDEPQRIRGSSRQQPGAREWQRPASPLEAQESPVRMVAHSTRHQRSWGRPQRPREGEPEPLRISRRGSTRNHPRRERGGTPDRSRQILPAVRRS